MDYKRREEIFSKEIISVKELAELFSINSLSNASNLLNKIKRKVGDRLGIEGKLHIEDYFEYFGIKSDRYVKPIEDTVNHLDIHEQHNQIFKDRGII